MYQTQSPEPSPVGEINTTPLIDVLLVLLVMLIITIPVQTHAVKFDLPGPISQLPSPNRTSNLLVVKADGSLRWNGTPIDRRELDQELAMTRQISPAPELHVQPDAEARHGDVDAVFAIVKREQISRFGFVGNEKYVNLF
jgi:biopolymer transport protein ExbD